ncbi:two-component regulator propeller domain-containing protein [Flavobacterium branchiarum]|uniref:Two-component regulator propeller domain-containing protein n=1 Tax=Flavobacterium branchiarum TaxID=1114870 RepID=A0ABV5FH06_9FLAO|nr:two-component regulator propeller domain-containing protein [Flavobacterium branchiarum]MDN3671791.1 two-component regulator propeller domain-containing protein [Flavobacterium branchiarum]
MKRYLQIHILLLMLFLYTSCQQKRIEGEKIIINSETKRVITPDELPSLSRNIIQDRKGNIWIATFTGVFRYDGNSFTNITSKVIPFRFFSILEDKKGNFWFGSIGSGAYYYDGKSFQNFTIKEGLLNNEVTSIYEDKKGTIWFGVSGGASRFDGKSFQNYIIEGNEMNVDLTGKTFPSRRPYEVNSIIEDKKGKIWFATRSNTFAYDGKTFSVFSHNDKPFKNVRSIIEDKKGNIWLGGADGLWRYDGNTFTNFTKNFTGYIIEDTKGNIWTTTQKGNSQSWALFHYDGNSLSDKKPIVTEISTADNVLFGILEARNGDIWFGSMNGVHRYDGKTIKDFKNKDN